MDADEMEKFFLATANYFFDNVEELQNLPATFIGDKLFDCYTYMVHREGN
jgi:hypothetical protein